MCHTRNFFAPATHYGAQKLGFAAMFPHRNAMLGQMVHVRQTVRMQKCASSAICTPVCMVVYIALELHPGCEQNALHI